MPRIYLLIPVVLFAGCKTSHEFNLTNTVPVPANEAPYIEILVKARIANLTSDLEASEGSTVRINEVPPTKSLDIDFDKNAFAKIVKAVCDSKVQDVKITAQNRLSMEGQWSSFDESGKYTAQVEIVEGKYTISCSKR